MRIRWWRSTIAFVAVALVGLAASWRWISPVSGQDLAATVASLGSTVGPVVRRRCADANLNWPPARLLLLAIKETRTLEIWGSNATGGWRLIAPYPFTAFCGNLGPKLAEGDRQIPEGLYRPTCLNPQSNYHLSIRLDYPNAFDRRMAAADGRKELGGDIYIHGNQVTIGCLPIGNAAIEEVFLLVHACGLEQTEVIIMPYDLRRQPVRATTDRVAWEEDIYQAIAQRLDELGLSRSML